MQRTMASQFRFQCSVSSCVDQWPPICVTHFCVSSSSSPPRRPLLRAQARKTHKIPDEGSWVYTLNTLCACLRIKVLCVEHGSLACEHFFHAQHPLQFHLGRPVRSAPKSATGPRSRQELPLYVASTVEGCTCVTICCTQEIDLTKGQPPPFP